MIKNIRENHSEQTTQQYPDSQPEHLTSLLFFTHFSCIEWC